MLLYGEEYASLHPFEGGKVQPGEPIDINRLCAMLKSEGNPREILPPYTVMRNELELCWWRPAGKVALIGSLLPRTAINLPPLVFTLSENEVRVAVLDRDEHPSGETRVYHLPLPNIYDDHSVCWGTGKQPGNSNPKAWEDAFSASEFNEIHQHDNRLKHP